MRTAGAQHTVTRRAHDLVQTLAIGSALGSERRAMSAPAAAGHRALRRDVEPERRVREAVGGASRSGQSMRRTAWVPDAPLSLAEWSEHGRRLGMISRAVGWWIGDWLRYGNERWGERYARAVRLTGYDAQTLMNMAYVASRYPISERREQLSWTHHVEVAACELSERAALLDHAEAERLSARCLREELRRMRRAAKSAVPEVSATIEPLCVCPHCGTEIRLERNGEVVEISS
jgi:hypothetical protein